MSTAGEGGTPTPGSSTGSQTDVGGGNTPKLYTQEEVDRIKAAAEESKIAALRGKGAEVEREKAAREAEAKRAADAEAKAKAEADARAAREVELEEERKARAQLETREKERLAQLDRDAEARLATWPEERRKLMPPEATGNPDLKMRWITSLETVAAEATKHRAAGSVHTGQPRPPEPTPTGDYTVNANARMAAKQSGKKVNR